MTSPLLFYSEDAVDELRDALRTDENRLKWYYCEDKERGNHKFEVPSPKEAKPRIELRCLGNLDPDAKKDAGNALKVYDALQELTPHQATVKGLWTYLCHNDCADYVTKRWLSAKSGVLDKTDRVKKVQSHFFVSGKGIRSLARNNGIARLWWLGHIAHQTNPEDPEKFLKILLCQQDIYGNLIGRPSVSSNYQVLKAIYADMEKDYSGERKFFGRQTFRMWMKNLNRRGGMVLFDALGEAELRTIIREEADKTLADA